MSMTADGKGAVFDVPSELSQEVLDSAGGCGVASARGEGGSVGALLTLRGGASDGADGGQDPGLAYTHAIQNTCASKSS